MAAPLPDLIQRARENPALLRHLQDEVQRQRMKKSLKGFVERFWAIIDPAAYVDNWHIDAICDHLEAVTFGEIRRLLINIPPRHAKSLIVCVFWPAWTWILDQMHDDDGVLLPTCGPNCRFLFFSYNERLSVRDNLKTRRIIRSPLYQRLFGDRVKVLAAQDTKTRFDLDAGGFRLSSSVSGFSTGEGGDVVGIDDPLSAKDASSETVRDETLRWFTEVMPTRFNDQKRSAQVIIMQRVHERDPSGYILARNLDYVHLCLPARFEGNHPHKWPGDPRTTDGELLFPARFGERELGELQTTMGSYAAAGQLQQRPVPREGGLFKRHWFQIVRAAPVSAQRVRAWDLASTEQSLRSMDPDWTAGLRMSRTLEGLYFVEDVQLLRGTPFDVEATIKTTAKLDGVRTKVRIPQDPGQAGKAQAKYLARQLAGFVIKIKPPMGDKTTRAEPAAAQAEAGNIFLVEGPWNEAFIDQLCSFPNAPHDDQVDAFADAFDELTNKTGTAGSIAGAW